MASAKKSDYRESAQERASSQVARSRYDTYNQKYAGLLKKASVEGQDGSLTKVLEKRANHDTMSAVTGRKSLSLTEVQRRDAQGDMASALTGANADAQAKGRSYSNDMGARHLAQANKLVGTATEGMSTLARLGADTAINTAQNKQAKSEAMMNAAVEVGSALTVRGMKNMSQKDQNGKSSFWTPGIVDTSQGLNGVDPKTGELIYGTKRATSLTARWNNS